MAWTLIQGIPSLGSTTRDNVQSLLLQLHLDSSIAFNYQPNKEQIYVSINSPDKFVTLEGTKLTYFNIQSGMPAYQGSVEGETESSNALGYLCGLIALVLFICHMFAKYFYGAYLHHSYFLINFLQISAIYSLYSIDMLPNANYFYRGLFGISHFRAFGAE